MLAPSKLVKTSVSSTTHKSFKPFKPNLLKRKRKKVVEESLEVAGGEVVEEEEIATQVAPLDQPVKQVIPTVGKIIPQPVVEEEDDFQPEIQEISLKDLIEDQFKEGRLSTREIQRREKVKEKRRSKRKIDEVATTPTETVEIQSSQPKLIVVNGKMVLDQESIQIRNQVQMHEGDIIEEDASNRYVTSLSFRSKHKLPNTKWSKQMTDRFYMGLSYFGTDFKQISYMFPGLTHKAIKMKFKAEEKKCEGEVSRALRERVKAPDEVRKKMLEGVAGKRVLEDGMYVQSRLESGKDSSDKPKPTVSKPKDTTEPDTTETRLETVVEEDETPQPPPKVDIIPKNLEIKTKKVVSGGMVAKGIKRRKKKVVHQSSGGDDLQMEVRPLE